MYNCQDQGVVGFYNEVSGTDGLAARAIHPIEDTAKNLLRHEPLTSRLPHRPNLLRTLPMFAFLTYHPGFQ